MVLAGLRSTVARANTVVTTTGQQGGDIADQVHALGYTTGKPGDTNGSDPTIQLVDNRTPRPQQPAPPDPGAPQPLPGPASGARGVPRIRVIRSLTTRGRVLGKRCRPRLRMWARGHRCSRSFARSRRACR